MSDSVIAERPAGKTISFPISKVNKEKREIWGYATTEALDQQGEIVDYEGSVRAFDRWTSQFEKMTDGKSLGNIREMHTSKAVGSLIAYQPDPEQRGIWVGVKVSDTIEGNDAWKKVDEGILNGFSIGAPTAERRMEYHGMGKVNRVVEYNLAELSLVDNPACPESFFEQVKLASTFVDGPPAYSMEILKRFAPGAAPSGEDRKAAPVILQKTVELNPETFVDGSGDVWTRLNGRITKKGNTMGDKALEKEVEKAGKKIGPAQKPAGTPPGPTANTEKDTPMEPMPSGEGMGKDAVPAENKPLGGDGANDGRNGGNGEQEKQIKDESEGPKGQGKAADAAHEEDLEAAKANDPDIDGKIAGASAAYCSICAGPMKSAGDNVAPYHRKCAAAKTAAAKGAGKSAAFGMTEDGIAKAVRAGIADVVNPILSKVNENFDVLSKRIEELAKSPAPGGPRRTELPSGVAPMEKAAVGAVSEGDAVIKALESTLPLIHDPMARQAVEMQIAKAGIVKSQNGDRRIMGAN